MNTVADPSDFTVHKDLPAEIKQAIRDDSDVCYVIDFDIDKHLEESFRDDVSYSVYALNASAADGDPIKDLGLCVPALIKAHGSAAAVLALPGVNKEKLREVCPPDTEIPYLRALLEHL